MSNWRAGMRTGKLINRRLKRLGGAAADALENVTIHGEEYLSIEELQQASGVGSSIIDRLRQVGALGDLPESSQVSFF